MFQRKIDIVVTVLFVLLVIFQIRTTNFLYSYELLPVEKDLQIKRMNLYPRSLAKLGYILEVKHELRLFEKFQNNFFSAIDLNQYFPNYFPVLLLPFFIRGLYLLVKNKKMIFLIPFGVAILLLSLVGVNGRFGPFIVFPFIVISVGVCFLNLAMLVIKR